MRLLARVVGLCLAGALMSCLSTRGDGMLAMKGRAFPTAVGYGQGATGWRQGLVVYVSTLADSGPGSLRACLEIEGPRVCLFAVSGTITVDSPIYVRPDVYVAGQTAPGEGVQLRLGEAQGPPIIVKNSHDVVLRYLKLRPGASRLPSKTVSAVLIENSHDVIVDHCSLAFATDQNLSIHFEHGSTYDVTVQHSIVAWGLDDANHPLGRHSKGALICSGIVSPDGCGRVTLMGNLFAHNRDRNPDIAGTGLGPIQVINNIFYDPISQFGEFYDRFGSSRIDYVANLTIHGRSTRVDMPPPALETYDFTPDHAVMVYAAGNLSMPHGRTVPEPAVIKVVSPNDQSPIPFTDLASRAVSARHLLEFVLPAVGARLRTGRLEDSLDAQVIRSVRERTGHVIDDPSQVGGWPVLSTIAAPEDRDGDGMPDDWEEAHPGVDPNDGADTWRDRDQDGTSNLEEYLNFLAGGEAAPPG